MKLVAHIRVSTRTQVEEGLGLEIQANAIKAAAKKGGHKIVAQTADKAISGAKELEDRVGLAEALAMVKDGRADGVIVYRLDRLARDLILQEQILAEVWRMGGHVLSTAPAEAAFLSNDPDDPSRKMIRQILGAVNEYERSMIRLRLRNGRRSKAEKGGYAYGAPSLGFKAEGRALVVDVEERKVLDRIAELHAAGSSTRAICAALEADGFKTKTGKTTWQSANVARIVKRLEASAA